MTEETPARRHFFKRISTETRSKAPLMSLRKMQIFNAAWKARIHFATSNVTRSLQLCPGRYAHCDEPYALERRRNETSCMPMTRSTVLDSTVVKWMPRYLPALCTEPCL